MAELVAPAPSDCVGPSSEQAGKASSCEGCPNQKICATAPKGPDPGRILLYNIIILVLKVFNHE